RESPHGLSLALRTEQPELDEILDVENPDGTLAVDDDDAVDLELLEELHRLVQKAFLAERHRVLRVADLAERLVENRAAVALQPAAQVPVGEDADGPAVGVDDRDRAETRFRHADHRRRQRSRGLADRVLRADELLDLDGHELLVLASWGEWRVG